MVEINEKVANGALYAVIKGRFGKESIKLARELKESETRKVICFIEGEDEVRSYKKSPKSEKAAMHEYWCGHFPLESTKEEIIRILRAYGK